MSETEKIITDEEGRHLRLYSIEASEEQAFQACEQLEELGFNPGMQAEPDGSFTVWSKLHLCEEIERLLDKQCAACTIRISACCYDAIGVYELCTNKRVRENSRWQESMGFNGALRKRLALLRMQMHK